MDYQKEADARIVIDDLLRQAGWDPADKSMVETEVLVLRPGEAGHDNAVASVSPLAAGRYKPQIAERPPEENPAQLIRETLALERKIVNGLEKLLREIEQ